MKIGFVVTQVASASGFENVVSGHVQLPMHTIKLLLHAGHDVQLITTEHGPNYTLPKCMPEGITVHYVTDGRRRGNGLPMEVGHKSWVRPLKLIKQIGQLMKIIRSERYDIVHFWGANRMAHLAGVLSLTGVKTPMALTFNNGRLPEKFWFLTGYLWRRVSVVVTSTEFLKNKCKALGLPVNVIRHGAVRNIMEENAYDTPALKPHRVLFWRDPSMENGADVCLKVFERLSPLFPEVSFVMAVRPHWAPVPGIEELAGKFRNVQVYKFPYPEGISLSKLLSESICVLLPFRQLSINPQFAIIESMLSGAAVITTALDSNMELINNGCNGYLVPVGDIEATLETVKSLLMDDKRAAEIGIRASKDIQAAWNWDDYTSTLLEVYERALRKKSLD